MNILKSFFNKASLVYLVILLISQFILSSVFAQTPVTTKLFADKTKSSVTYSLTHPLHKWDGTSKDVSSLIVYNRGNKLIENVAVAIKIGSFDSENANRDSHTIEVLEAIKIPNVTFTSTSIKAEGDELKITGNLTFHGVTKPISFSAKASNNGKELAVTGNFEIKITDFQITPPSLMGLATQDLIKLRFSVVYNL